MITYYGIDGHLYSPQIIIFRNAGISFRDCVTQQNLNEEEDRYKQPQEALLAPDNNVGIQFNNEVYFIRPQNVLDSIRTRGGTGIVGFDTTMNYAIGQRLQLDYGRLNVDGQEEMEKIMESYIRKVGFEPLVPLRYRKSRLVLACQKDGIKSVDQLIERYKDNGGAIVVSEYPSIAEDYCRYTNIPTNGGIITSYGRTEALGDKKLGLADAIIETAETGGKIESRNYGILSVVMSSIPWLIADQKSYDKNRDEINRFRDLMENARDKAMQEEDSKKWFIDRLFSKLNQLMFRI